MKKISKKIPPNRQVDIYLKQTIYGIGISTATKILKQLNIDPKSKFGDLSENQLSSIRNECNKLNIEGNLRREIALNIKRLKEIGCDRGIHHRRGLPVRGQKTRNNAKTAKKSRKKVSTGTTKFSKGTGKVS
ncbi:30S ribosomal protein S13 [Candidatus Phytoplasma fraxini]|uniref:Small ribosomal subunit protein uS13 n=1 Tax=Ash yellows phytoplasma TaxID=35780 RepID=A0ABZ2U7T1_ASHYP